MKGLTLEQIEKEMAGGGTPGRLAELRVLLSAKYAHATNQYEAILMSKPAIWNELRKDVKSDTRAEREWEATELGQKERHWRLQLKKIDRMMSAINTLIKVKTNEAMGIY